MKTKKLEIYQENGEFIIKRTNEFGTPLISRYATENGLKESIQHYKRHVALDEYEIDVDESLWALVINELSK
ncbi:hypothetical protein V7024_21150 [Bacillus sp. JJ864]|uniref:hypothetical protein n=1 Tax=Bacillus sp. JJ864 TaxID=3122975 RepID=UPI0030006DC5